jgi:hypothetical protein
MAIFKESARKLHVRDYSTIFDPKSMYGHRSIVHPGLLITSTTDSVFHRSAAWRQQAVQMVNMLPRENMIRPSVEVSQRMTDVQDLANTSDVQPPQLLT